MSTAAPSSPQAAPAQLPFFVYGTLMSGFQNNRNVLRGRETSALKAQLPGALLFHYPAGFPGMKRSSEAAGSSSVHGELISVAASDFLSVLQDCDLLEDFISPGHPENMYSREVVTVAVTDASSSSSSSSAPPRLVQAYTYFSLLENESSGAVPVPEGDGRAWMQQHTLQDAADDWQAKQRAFQEGSAAGTNAGGVV